MPFAKQIPCQDCLLNDNSIFRHLHKIELGSISQAKNCSIYRKGSVIFNEGSRLNNIYCINRGIVKLYRTGTNGKEQILSFVKKGEIIGHRAVLSGELAANSAKVMEDAQICTIPSETIFNFIGTNPSFSAAIIQMLCIEINRLTGSLTDLAQKSVRERLAGVILMLKDTFNLDESNYIKISLTREELANLVGTATETIIRLLSEFNKDNIIELRGRKIKILNIQSLVRMTNM